MNASQGEDCLFINVWRPSNATTDSNLPVWVFLSGGGYAYLANANYNGSKVVEESGNGIIFVNLNYRVGALGFLASEEIRQDGALNAGLLDQRKALLWVQQHIRKFGGNPDHVVIHGDSAGAGSVAHHLTAYGGQDMKLFVGAIAESSFWPTQRTVSETQFQYNRFVRDVGCEGAPNTLACLRSADISRLQEANVPKPFPGGSNAPLPLWYFLPVVDGRLVPGRLNSLFKQNKFIHVPLVVTDDNNEGSIYAYNATSPSEVAQFFKNNYPRLNESQLNSINKAYPLMRPLPEHAPYFPSASAAYGESTFVCPGNLMAATMAKYFATNRVWNCRYNVQDPSEIAQGFGVPHVFELPAIFGIGSTNKPAASYANINANVIPLTMDYFISFVKALDPNSYRNENAPLWRSWGGESGQRLKLQTNATTMEKLPPTQIERCLKWHDIAISMQN